MIKSSQIIETTKSVSSIRNVISQNTDAHPGFWTSFRYKASNAFISKQGDNYISLRATNGLLNWPFIELHMRENIEPRLRIKFQGLYFFVAFYILQIISYIVLITNVSTAGLDVGDVVPMIMYGFVLVFIPFYASRLQDKFKSWIDELLDELDC